MQTLSRYEGDPRQLSPVTLAFVGDAVFEIMVRARLVQVGSMPANALHKLSVQRVNAAAQASAYEAVEAMLTEEERGVLARGKNAKTSNIPKSCTLCQYHKATALEALLGYLYLSGSLERLEEVYTVMDNIIAGRE